MRSTWSALRREDGQTSAEYIGVIVVLAAVIAALLLGAPGVGRTITDGIKAALCQMIGSGCETPLAEGEPKEPCVVSSTSGTAGIEATVGFVDLGGGKGLLVEEFSDDRIEVTFIDTSKLGVSTGVKAGGKVTIGGTEVGLNAEARAAAAVLGEAADTRIFRDEEEARDYIRDRALGEAIETLPPGARQLAGGVRGMVDFVTGHKTPEGEEGDEKASLGVQIGGEANAVAGPLGAEVEAALGAGVAGKVKPDGSRTFQVQVDAKIAGAAGVPVLAQLGASGASTVLIALDVDAQGNPTKLKISGQVDGSFSPELLSNLDPGEALDALKASIKGSEGKRSVVELNIDLSNGEVADAALELIDQAPRVGNPNIDTDALVAAGGDLRDSLTGNSTLSVTNHHVDSTGLGLEGGLMAGIGLDLGAEGTMVTTTLDSAYYLDPTTGSFVPWAGCEGG